MEEDWSEGRLEGKLKKNRTGPRNYLKWENGCTIAHVAMDNVGLDGKDASRRHCCSISRSIYVVAFYIVASNKTIDFKSKFAYLGLAEKLFCLSNGISHTDSQQRPAKKYTFVQVH